MITLENLKIPDLAVVIKREDLEEINLRVYSEEKKDKIYYFRLTCEDDDLIYCEFISSNNIIDENSAVTFKLNSFGETYTIPKSVNILTFKWEVLILDENEYDVTKDYKFYQNNNKKNRGFMIYFVDIN